MRMGMVIITLMAKMTRRVLSPPSLRSRSPRVGTAHWSRSPRVGPVSSRRMFVPAWPQPAHRQSGLRRSVPLWALRLRPPLRYPMLSSAAVTRVFPHTESGLFGRDWRLLEWNDVPENG